MTVKYGDVRDEDDRSERPREDVILLWETWKKASQKHLIKQWRRLLYSNHLSKVCVSSAIIHSL